MSEKPEGTTPGEQDHSQQQAPDGFIEKARYTGAIQKIESLTSSNKDLTSELAAKSSEIEQLNQRLAELEAGQQSLAGEKDAKISDLQSSLQSLEAEKSQLAAFKLKADLAKEMGRPDLLPILDHLPAYDDAEALKGALTDLANFADGAAQAREKELRAGVTETPTSKPGATAPASPQAWVDHIESLPLGSPERMEAANRFGDWLAKQEQ